MKALVFNGTGKITVESRPKPSLQKPTDAIVKVNYTTICGTDLHILKGDVPEVQLGTILGHEGVGTIEELGAGVTRFTPGDQVLLSCISACGTCEYCKRGMNSHCETGGWVLGHTIDGTQAEYVRIPHADSSLYKIPQGVSQRSAVLLSDILPTGYECGVLNSKIQPGSTVAIIGAGPVGLAALLTAKLYTPSWVLMIDTDKNRLDVAKELGAEHVAQPSDVSDVLERLTDGRGCDAVIEAVGIPATFEQCQELVAPGGVIANVGVHGASVQLRLEKLWSYNVSITTRLVDATTTSMLLKLAANGKLPLHKLITHNYKFADIQEAYGTFKAAAENRALKMLIELE